MRRYLQKDVILNEPEAISYIKQWAYPYKAKADLQPLFNRMRRNDCLCLGKQSMAHMNI
jgi:hypothetical protein